jgi:hypothetical protein
MVIRCPPNILGNLSECVMGDNIICLYVGRSAIYLPSAAGYNTFGGGVYAVMQQSEIMSGAHPCFPTLVGIDFWVMNLLVSESVLSLAKL